MTKPRLKPCPFCGNEYPSVSTGICFVVVACRDIHCDAHGPRVLRESYKNPTAQAVRLWNRRAKNV